MFYEIKDLYLLVKRIKIISTMYTNGLVVHVFKINKEKKDESYKLKH